MVKARRQAAAAFDYVTFAGTPDQMTEWHSPTESKARGKIKDWLEKQVKWEQRFSAANAAALSGALVDFDSTVFDPRYPIDVEIPLDTYKLRFRMEARAATVGPKGGKR